MSLQDRLRKRRKGIDELNPPLVNSSGLKRKMHCGLKLLERMKEANDARHTSELRQEPDSGGDKEQP